MSPTARGRFIAYAWGTPRRAALTAIAAALLLLAVSLWVPGVRELVTAGVAVLAPLSLIVKAYPNESKQIAARGLGVLSAVSKTAEREAVRQDLEGTLSLGAARLTAMSPEGAILPLRIDYLRSENEVELLPDGSLIVGVARHQNRDRNLVAAAWVYVQNAVLPYSRGYLDADVSKGLDFVLTREILIPAGQGPFHEFLRSIWSPAILGQARLRDLCEKMDRLQEDDLLGPIVLSEFHELATSVGFRLPTQSIQEESAHFVDYLYDLAIREPGANVGDLANFEGDAIRCKIVFVARPDVYEVKGPSAYRKAIDWAIRRAYRRIYLLGLGRNVDYVTEVAQPYRSDSRVTRVAYYRGTRRYRTGRVLEQVVACINVDVRYHVGIGQRPIVSVGPGRTRNEASKSAAR